MDKNMIVVPSSVLQGPIQDIMHRPFVKIIKDDNYGKA